MSMGMIVTPMLKCIQHENRYVKYCFYGVGGK